MRFCLPWFRRRSIGNATPSYDESKYVQPDDKSCLHSAAIVDSESPPPPYEYKPASTLSPNVGNAGENIHGAKDNLTDPLQLSDRSEIQGDSQLQGTPWTADPQPRSKEREGVDRESPTDVFIQSQPPVYSPQHWARLPQLPPSLRYGHPLRQPLDLYNPVIPKAQGIRPPPPIPGVLPPSPFFGPPKNPTLIIPPGTQTEFKLLVRQQPERARICRFEEKGRYVIDPPPIVVLIENNDIVSSTQKHTLVLQCTLYNEEGTEHRNRFRTIIYIKPTAASSEQLKTISAIVMTGRIFSNAVSLEDEHGKDGFFFIFPDLSIHLEGRYRLKFDLLRSVLPPYPPHPILSTSTNVVAEVFSDVFVVYAAKTFPGMLQSTPLTKAIARQGIQLGSMASYEAGEKEKRMQGNQNYF